MSKYILVRDYPYPIEEVWSVLTEPELVARWTTTGQGGRPEGFSPVAGTEFRFVGTPTIGWDGVVYCTVLEVDAPRMLHYSWRGDAETDRTTDVRYRLEPTASGTRLTWEHTGFTGLGGLFMSTLLGGVRRKMLDRGLPGVLASYHAELGGSSHS